MDPNNPDPFQPRPPTPPATSTDQAGQYAPMVNPGNPQPAENQAAGNSGFSDQQAVDWARSKIASLHHQPVAQENPVQQQLQQSQSPTPETHTTPGANQPLAKVPAFMPKQEFGTYELPEEEEAPTESNKPP